MENKSKILPLNIQLGDYLEDVKNMGRLYPDENLIPLYGTQLGNILLDYDHPQFVKFLREAFY